MVSMEQYKLCPEKHSIYVPRYFHDILVYFFHVHDELQLEVLTPWKVRHEKGTEEIQQMWYNRFLEIFDEDFKEKLYLLCEEELHMFPETYTLNLSKTLTKFTSYLSEEDMFDICKKGRFDPDCLEYIRLMSAQSG